MAARDSELSSSTPAPTGPIGILPSPGTPYQCAAATSSAQNGTVTLPLQDGSLDPSTFNVPPNTTGRNAVCYEPASGSVYGYTNWTDVGAGTNKTGGAWFSYPEVSYGVNDWAGAYSTYTHQSPPWELPQPVSAVTGENVWFTTSFSINPPRTSNITGYDLSFDDFLTQSLPPEFEHGPFVEVLVLIAHDIHYPFEWTPWSTATLVNSTVTDAPWDVGYWCHAVHNASNASVTFDFAYDTQASPGLYSGTLGVNLSAVLAEVVSLMPGVTCWTGPTHGFSGFDLDQANLGAEAGALYGHGLDYNWTLSDYCIHVLRGGASPANLSCGAEGSAAAGLIGPGSPGLSLALARARPRDGYRK